MTVIFQTLQNTIISYGLTFPSSNNKKRQGRVFFENEKSKE